MLLSGVRSSWDILARNSDLYLLEISRSPGLFLHIFSGPGPVHEVLSSQGQFLFGQSSGAFLEFFIGDPQFFLLGLQVGLLGCLEDLWSVRLELLIGNPQLFLLGLKFRFRFLELPGLGGQIGILHLQDLLLLTGVVEEFVIVWCDLAILKRIAEFSRLSAIKRRSSWAEGHAEPISMTPIRFSSKKSGAAIK